VRLFTVGHSTHSLEVFHALLTPHGVRRIVDVRRFPHSRRDPEFNAESLATSLPARGIDYRHLPGLGGRRRPSPGTPNGGWDNDAFRGYADHAMTAGFAVALDELCALARECPTAVMCAEGLWWRCHRRLIADRLSVLDWTVLHITPDGRLVDHALPPFAIPQADGIVLYPPAQTSLTEP